MAHKRVLIFSLAYYPKAVGGAEVAIKEITDRIDPGEIEFHMVTLRFDSMLPKVEQVGNVLVHRIGPSRENPTMADLKKWPLHFNKHLYQFLAAWKAHKLHKRYGYEGMWVMMTHSCGVPAALFKILHKDVSYVQTLQEGDPPEHIERLARPVWPLFKRAFTTPTVIQSISTFLADWARRMDATCPIEIVTNGVDTKNFTQKYSEEEIAQAKQKLGKKEGDIFIITTSRLVHKNAVDDVIRALPLLDSNVYFMVLGTGPDEDMLRSLADELKVTDRVHFLGQVDHADMPVLLKACDIFIRPSRSEGMGNSFIEAMAAQVPVIATQEGGIADFLFDTKRNPDKPTTGWAVSKDSPDEIAAVVKDIVSNPDHTQQVTQTAYVLACREYDWNLIATRMREKVFSYVTGGR